MSRVTIIRPDDWHLHLRDGEQMRAVLPDTAKRFARAIVMPNLTPPVTTTDMALMSRGSSQATGSIPVAPAQGSLPVRACSSSKFSMAPGAAV